MRETFFNRNNVPVWSLQFDDLQDMVEYCKSPTEYTGHKLSEAFTAGYHECRSFREAVKVVSEGWLEGEEKARRFTNVIFDKISQKIEQPQYFYEVEGLDFDVSRVLAGEPEVWIDYRPKPQEAAGRVIQIVCNGFTSGGVDKSVIIARGSVLAAIAQLLEFSGRVVEVILRFDIVGNYDQAGRMEISVMIKRAGQPMNFSEVVFAMGHPDMLRRFCWSVMEHGTPEWRRILGAGRYYGMPSNTVKEFQGDIFLDRMSYGDREWTSPERAEALAIEKLAEQGVEVSK